MRLFALSEKAKVRKHPIKKILIRDEKIYIYRERETKEILQNNKPKIQPETKKKITTIATKINESNDEKSNN